MREAIAASRVFIAPQSRQDGGWVSCLSGEDICFVAKIQLEEEEEEGLLLQIYLPSENIRE